MRVFCILLLMIMACSEPEPPPPEPPKPPDPALSLTPTPAKIRSIIDRMDKDTATEEESALVAYAKDKSIQEMVVGELLNALKDPRPKVRGHVLRVIELVADQPAVRTDAMVDALVPLLDDPDQWVPIKAADALGKIKVKKAIPILIERLDDASIERAEAARQALVNSTGQTKLGKSATAWRKWWEKNESTFTPTPD